MKLPAISSWGTRLFSLPHVTSGAGEITLAGTIADADGAGRPRDRVFGQWALVYMVSGRGKYHDQRGNIEEMVPGKWILVFPELAHSYGPLPGSRWDEIYVCFRGPVFEAWRSAGVFDPARPTGQWLEPEQGTLVFEKFFQRIQAAGCTSLHAICFWQEILADILGGRALHAPPRDGWLGRAIEMLEQSSAEGGLLRQTAKECGLSYESFRKKFENAMGVPPGRYAAGYRIERARRLLTLQSLTNAEIALMLGFYDEFHFSKTFSQWTGMSPKQFRKQAREQ